MGLLGKLLGFSTTEEKLREYDREEYYARKCTNCRNYEWNSVANKTKCWANPPFKYYEQSVDSPNTHTDCPRFDKK